MNPWAEDAEALVGREAIIAHEERVRIKRLVADALARAYEYGFAQGRLAEIDRVRKEAP